MCQAQWLKPLTPATWKAEIRRMEIQGQPWQKVQETPSQPKAVCCMWYASVNPAMWGSLERIIV
jgi:hypothetical protein